MAYKLKENLLVGIGHPLLDITAIVEKDILTKYKLKENDAVIATESHKGLQKKLLENYPVTFTVGGSIQNTLRIIQWLTETPKLTTFFGAVGKDELSKILLEKATIDGVNVRYQYTDKECTGTCIVLVNKENRSLCTQPGSSKLFTIEHIRIPANKTLLDAAKYYYMGGFFLTVSPEITFEVSKLAALNNSQFLFNISARFICKNFKDILKELIPYCDIIFGNKSEIEALAEAFQIESKSIDETLLALANWTKINDAQPRIVVLTQGENPVIVAKEDIISKFPTVKLEKARIVDTNGAGDAFVGGFLSQYIQGKNIEMCVKCGIWAATKIIQRIGCTYEGKAYFHIET